MQRGRCSSSIISAIEIFTKLKTRLLNEIDLLHIAKTTLLITRPDIPVNFTELSTRFPVWHKHFTLELLQALYYHAFLCVVAQLAST